MNTIIKLATLIISFALVTSCQEDLNDQFNNANPNSILKYITRLETENEDGYSPNVSIDFTYDNNNRVITIEDRLNESNSTDPEASIVYSSSGAPETAINSNGTYDFSQLYESPYDFTEAVSIVDYDSNGNPQKLETFSDGIGSDIIVITISYDNNPYPLFPMMESSGLLELGDNMDFGFYPIGSPFLNLRDLVPFNNPTYIEFREKNGPAVSEVYITYTYDQDGYALEAEVNSINLENSSVAQSHIKYSY